MNEAKKETLPAAAPNVEVAVDPDAELVSRAQQGDAAAFNQLVQRHQNRVLNLSFRMLRDRELAEEVAQDVFVSVFRHLRGFQGNSRFSTWMYRVVVNHCQNKSKYLKRRRHRQHDSLQKPIETQDGQITRDLPDEPGRTPEDLVGRRTLNAAIQEGIAALDEDHRAILLLRDVEDLAYEEIAAILGLPEGTVKSRLHRARNELRQRLSNKVDP